MSGDRPDSGVISPLRFLSGGLEFALICTLAALLGQWADARLGSTPWMTVILLVLGFGTATWILLRSLSRSSDQDGEHE